MDSFWAISNTILSFLLAKRRDESGTCVQRLIIIIIIIFFEITFYVKYGFQKGSLKIKKKIKIHSIREDVKKLKYVKTIKMYKILTQIHLNYIFKRLHLKIFRFTDCLIAWLRELKSLIA